MVEIKVFFLLSLCTLKVICIWSPSMENPHLWQGDIELDPDEEKRSDSGHQFVSIKGHKWPNGRIPYVIESSLGNDGYYAIKFAIQRYHRFTCLRFHKRTNEKEYISFRTGAGCSSPIGYREGRVNYVKLGPYCWETGIAMHEIGHSVGLDHQQSRADRDQYIKVFYDNIVDGMEHNFDKRDPSIADPLLTPYDFSSMMHYGERAFGIDNKITIRTIDPSKQNLIGQRNGFSDLDIKELQIMYGDICKAEVTSAPTKQPTIIPTTKSICHDVSPKCPAYASMGRCTNKRWINWMRSYCCAACKRKER